MIYLTVVLTIGWLMISLWLLSLRLHDVSIVDIAWGIGFILVAWASYVVRCLAVGHWHMPWLPGLVSLWGLRLSGHLYLRNHGQPEDFRYRQMRDRWGQSFWWISAGTVFGLQGAVMWIVSLPLQWSAVTANWPLALTGTVVWAIGFGFEAVGDWQLSRFRADPANRGQVLDRGLWRYTRHPNYFGDFLVWWGFYLIALASSAPVWTLVSPLLMSFLLIRVSGVRLLEATLRQSKPEYAAYVQRTSSFFPMPPKSN